MAGIKLSPSEQERSSILGAAIQGKISNSLAAKQLHLSIRQIKRKKADIRKYGETAVIHHLKGRPSNHRIDTATKERVLSLIKKKYADFKPTLATEKLLEKHGIAISVQTTRRWMTEADLWKVHKKKGINYRSWRPRKEFYGELIQFDGSYHYWFEDRYIDQEGNPIEACLLAAIDDATGEIVKAKFTKNEGTIEVFTFWKEYVEKIGKSLTIYLDAFCTYKINHKMAVDNKELMTQFQRAMQALGITLITARSAEAKGRVERLFGTLQDRLVKEMRLAGVNTPKDGNLFLKEFIPLFNKKFSVVPAKAGNVHRTVTQQEKHELGHTFSLQEIRRVNRDFTIQFNNKWFQLTEIQPTTVRAKDQVIMETWLDGSTHIKFRDTMLTYTLLPEKPKKQLEQPVIITTHKLNYKPPPDHPWRKKMM